MEAVELINLLYQEILAEIDRVSSRIDYGDAVRSQLLAGIDGDGKELRPRYTEDSYFHSREAALKYVGKFGKRDVQAFPQWGLKARNWDTPNLIITGAKFHNYITAKYSDGSVNTQAAGSPIEGTLRAKYGDKILALSPSVKERIEEELNKAIDNITKKYGIKWLA